MFDVVVVGGGVAGVSAAAALADTCRVALVEMEPAPAQHASGRSASVLSETSGHPVVCALARSSRAFFEQPPAGFAEHPLVSRRGLMWVGEAADADALDALTASAMDGGCDVHRLSVNELQRLLPSFSPDAVAGGGVHEPNAMAIDTAALIEGFLRVVRSHGGTVRTATEAIRLERVGNGWRVTASGDTIHAAIVVDAAGAWGDVVAARAGVPALGLEPRRRTAAIARVPEPIGHWPLVMDIAGRYYCEPDPGGLLISPADETLCAPCDAQAEELDVALAIERVRDATGLPLRSIVRAWAGLRTFAPDRVPVAGEDPDFPGFWWLVGQGGAGIKTAPALAAFMARQITGREAASDHADLGVSAEALSPARLRR